MPSLLINNAQTMILTDTPVPSKRARSQRRRRPAITAFGILLTILAIAAVFHIDIISDSIRRAIGPSGRSSPAIAEPSESSLFGAPVVLAPEADASDTAPGTQPQESAAGAPPDNPSPEHANDSLAATIASYIAPTVSAEPKPAAPREIAAGTTVPAGGVPGTPASTGKTPTATAQAPTKEIPAETAPATTSEPARRPVPHEGWLSVSADPWAAVYIDEHYRADTPPATDLSLPAGAHSLECRNPQYETYREEIHITAGELSRRTITLKKLMGKIQLFTEPGSEFYLDGTFRGITPLAEVIEVDAGRHQLTIKKQGYNTWSSEVSVEANRTMPLRIRLSPQF